MDGRVSLSDPVGKERSDEIDRMLEEGKVNVNYDLKVLVLGALLPFLLPHWHTGTDSYPDAGF